MKLFPILLAASIATLVNAVAVVSEADLPTCALLCLETEILASSCSVTNTTCQCTNAPLVAAITTCVTANCTVRESLTTKAYTENNCGAEVRDDSQAVTIAALVGLSVAVVAFALRMMSRCLGAGGKFWWDDAVLCLAMALILPLSAFSVVLTKHGLGKDVWTLSFDDITIVAYIYMWDEFMYLSSLPLTKISILCFYLRIFPDKKFRYMTFATMGLCVGYLIAFIVASIWQCIPIHGAWTRWDGTFEGHCNNINLQGWTSAAANIVLDLIVIILPLPQLSKMNMSGQKKVSIVGMFCVGFFITVVSVIRLKTLLQFGGTSNMTWDYVSIGYWSTIEVHVSLICACLPAIRALVKQRFPGFMTTRKGASTSATPKSPFTSFASRKKDLEKGGSIQVSSKPKDADVDHFIPLVNFESANRSHLHLSTGPHNSPNSALSGEPEFVMCHSDIQPRIRDL